jgi:signal transduction histidine kinase
MMMELGLMPLSLPTTSNGLRNMRRRVDELKGTMTNKNHQGTTRDI